MSSEPQSSSPDAHLEALVTQVKEITERWAKRHELWHDSWHKDPVAHYDSEPGEGEPILLLCSDGPAMTSLEWDDEFAVELRNELEQVGVYTELEDRVTACYHLIDHESQLQAEFDRLAAWRWTCSLIRDDSADVSGDLYEHFAGNPEDFHRLPHREFERLVSSIFSARGWRSEIGPGSGDGGVDLRLWQSDPLGDLLTLVQVKRYAPHRAIGLEAVAALEAHVEREHANRGLFVTSSRFLPGVHDFASKNKHRLQLADRENIRSWCAELAQSQMTARYRALALDGLAPLLEELRAAGSHPRLLFGDRRSPSFCIVLLESKRSALLMSIPSKRIAGDEIRGAIVPALDASVADLSTGAAVFRAKRSEKDGRVSYWGHRALFHRWDGSPCSYDHWD